MMHSKDLLAGLGMPCVCYLCSYLFSIIAAHCTEITGEILAYTLGSIDTVTEWSSSGGLESMEWLGE